jgi:hypothetical protein
VSTVYKLSKLAIFSEVDSTAHTTETFELLTRQEGYYANNNVSDI